MSRFAGGWLSKRDIQSGARMRLFCLPHAGSGAAGFYRWRQLLPAGVDVCPVWLPGREVRLAEPSLQDATALVDQLIAVAEPYLDVPFALFGHSMGALLAYEFAVRLQAARLRGPEWMFVSGREAPHLPFVHRELYRLGDEAFVAELRRRYGGMPEGFLADAELREVFLPILRADLRLVESYRHGERPLLRCPIDAFAGKSDSSVSDDGLAAWVTLTTGAFAWRRLPGDHFFHAGPGQPELLRLISERLRPFCLRV